MAGGNDGDQIDPVGGANVTITPDDANTAFSTAITSAINTAITSTISSAINTDTSGGGKIGGRGTAGHMPRFTGGTTIGNSLVDDNRYQLGLGNPNARAGLTVSEALGVVRPARAQNDCTVSGDASGARVPIPVVLGLPMIAWNGRSDAHARLPGGTCFDHFDTLGHNEACRIAPSR